MTHPTPGSRIDIVSDAICPWCYIGKRQLERALASLRAEGLAFTTSWNPFQLNPDMPQEGVARAAYREAKFGSAERAAALDARVSEAAAGVGLAFALGRQTRTPNTIAAHRLIRWAGLQTTQGGGPATQDAAMEAVFHAYFVAARDTGDAEVLADCAAEAGLDRAAARAFLASDAEADAVRAADAEARASGVTGVPSFFLDGYFLFSGAVPAEQMQAAFRQARSILLQRAA